MHPVFYYIAPYILLGGLGMYLGNKRVTSAVAGQRWLKFFTYVIIVLIVLLTILFNQLVWLASLIALVGAIELVYANYFIANKRHAYFPLIFIWYLILSFGFTSFAKTFGPSFQLFIYFQVFIFDAFCQITGQLLGKHSLSPRISPTKTIEGLAGGILFCILSGVLARNWVNISIPRAAVFGIITCATCFTGDMLASYYKRVLGIKDYSRLLPGQGGFLDRFDSFIMTGAVYYGLAYFFAPLFV